MICSQPITVAAAKINKIHIENRTYSVPCGVCAVCKQNRVQEWVYRLQQEQKNSISTDFITLTYEDQNMPMVWSEYHNNSVGTLNPDDLKNFWKRLRKQYPKPKIKYYACGEYGEKTWRPHYHAIIFNLPTEEYEKRDLIWKAWGLGKVDISTEPVGKNALAYTAKYIDKIDFMHSEDVRTKKFSRMSQGLGKSYLTPEMVKWHRDNILDRNYVPLDYSDGSKQKMPQYYRNKIYTKLQRHQQAEQVQKEKLEKEAELEHPFQTEYNQKLYAENKFNSSVRRNKRDGTSRTDKSMELD